MNRGDRLELDKQKSVAKARMFTNIIKTEISSIFHMKLVHSSWGDTEFDWIFNKQEELKLKQICFAVYFAFVFSHRTKKIELDCVA